MLVIASHLDDSRVVVALGYNFDVFCANTDAAPAVDETFGTDEATESYGLDNLDQAIPVPLAIPVRLFAAVARAELVKDPSLDRKALMAKVEETTGCPMKCGEFKAVCRLLVEKAAAPPPEQESPFYL